MAVFKSRFVEHFPSIFKYNKKCVVLLAYAKVLFIYCYKTGEATDKIYKDRYSFKNSVARTV